MKKKHNNKNLQASSKKQRVLSTYSLRVRRIRRLLIATFAVVIASFLLWVILSYTILSNSAYILYKIVAQNVSSNVDPIVLTGINSKGVQYYITSDKLNNYIESFFDGSDVNLEKPYIELIFPDHSKIKAVSDTGVVTRSSYKLIMKSNVKVEKSDGSVVYTDEMIVDISKNIVSSVVPSRGYIMGNTVTSKGFVLDDTKKSLVITGNYHILNTQNSSAVNISAQDDLFTDTNLKYITTKNKFKATYQDMSLSGDLVKVWYNNFQNLSKNLRNNSFENFKKIQIVGNVRFYNTDLSFSGDEYINDVAKNIMVLNSKNHPVIYETPKVKVVAHKRFEYMNKSAVLAARGKPIVYIKDKNNPGKIQARINQQLLVINLDKNNHLKTAESFDKVILKSNNMLIKGDYALYTAMTNIVSVEDNVKLIGNGSTLNGCRLILDLNTNESKLIPCGSQKRFNININQKSKNK